MYEAGVAKTVITGYKEGVGMMGYGADWNIVKGKASELYARVVAIRYKPSGSFIVFVNAEICFITYAIRKGVLKKLERNHPGLGISEDNLVLTAQHTHSGPGGYSHYPFYNFSIPGFVPEVYFDIVNGITQAVVDACNTMQPVKISIARGVFEPELEVAFNRSLIAYNSNPEVEPVRKGDEHLAVDREMILMRIDAANGLPVAMINWFGVHATSISNDNLFISSDNKGYASCYFEEWIKDSYSNPGFVAIFAQRYAGDVSPNWIWDAKKKWTRGKYTDDFESARFNGKLQFEKAREIFENTRNHLSLEGPVYSKTVYVDFSHLKVNPEYAGGSPDARTWPACHGVAFFLGTAEGPGMPQWVGQMAKVLCRAVRWWHLAPLPWKTNQILEYHREKYRIQDPKDILMETGEGKILGVSNLVLLPMPGWLDKRLKTVKDAYRDGTLKKKPWVPNVLPIQLLTIGDKAIACVPAEITTVAGRRLKRSLERRLNDAGIDEVIISTYANDYCGYITTFEEYQHQCYEGGHTVYGKWTLGAFQTAFDDLALQMIPDLNQFTAHVNKGL